MNKSNNNCINTISSSLLFTILVLILLLLLAANIPYGEAEVNKSEGLNRKPEKDLTPLDKADAQHDFDEGGFSSLDGMLQWAIGHSDPTKLKETAKDAQHLSSDELSKQQLEIKELMERLKMPSDAQLMRVAIDDLNNSSMTVEDHYRALQELLELVEPIDNANDLHKLGGLSVVIRELSNTRQDIRMISARILGTASQNNPLVQKQILELGGLKGLMTMVNSGFSEEAIKAMFALSALIRNNFEGRELFYVESGDLMLQDMLSNSSTDTRLLKKCLFLVADLAECQLEIRDKPEPHFFSNNLFLKSVVDLLKSSDLDLQEKALVAIKNMLQLKTTEALAFKDVCGLEKALERVRQKLHQLADDEYQREYARDVESLINEIELIFHGKLNNISNSNNISDDMVNEVPSLGYL